MRNDYYGQREMFKELQGKYNNMDFMVADYDSAEEAQRYEGGVSFFLQSLKIYIGVSPQMCW